MFLARGALQRLLHAWEALVTWSSLIEAHAASTVVAAFSTRALATHRVEQAVAFSVLKLASGGTFRSPLCLGLLYRRVAGSKTQDDERYGRGNSGLELEAHRIAHGFTPGSKGAGSSGGGTAWAAASGSQVSPMPYSVAVHPAGTAPSPMMPRAQSLTSAASCSTSGR